MQNNKLSMPNAAQGSEAPTKNQNNWNENFKNYVVYATIALVGVILLYTYVLPQQSAPQEISLSQAISDIGSEKVSTATVDGNRVELKYKDSDTVKVANKEPGDTIDSQLEVYG